MGKVSSLTLREVSKYGVFSSPSFSLFGLNTNIYLRMQIYDVNTDQKKLGQYQKYSDSIR